MTSLKDPLPPPGCLASQPNGSQSVLPPPGQPAVKSPEERILKLAQASSPDDYDHLLGIYHQAYKVTPLLAGRVAEIFKNLHGISKTDLSNAYKRYKAEMVRQDVSDRIVADTSIQIHSIAFGDLDQVFPKINIRMMPFACRENFEALMNHYGIFLWENAMTHELQVSDQGRYGLEGLDEASLLTALVDLASNNYMPHGRVMEFVWAIARRNQHHPFELWLRDKQWDGADRFTPMLNTVSVSQDDLQRWHLIFKRWCVQVVACVYGYKHPEWGLIPPRGVCAPGCPT